MKLRKKHSSTVEAFEFTDAMASRREPWHKEVTLMNRDSLGPTEQFPAVMLDTNSFHRLVRGEWVLRCVETDKLSVFGSKQLLLEDYEEVEK